MSPEDILGRLAELRIIPVVVIEDDRQAVPLAEALQAGGLGTMEITLRTDAGLKAIELLARRAPGMLLGAGTVLTAEHARRAVEAGARYIVAPGLSRKVVEWCIWNSVPVIPGVVTPTEIETAMDLGLGVVKFFPAEASGGVAYLKAICAPYRSMKFIPTGGIDEKNVAEYLKLPQVAACGGSWMVKPDLLKAGRFDEVHRLAVAAASIAARLPV
jgi:2-dehydro-3-deoxyphosphogluconate aldolase/(4S)-4-hydroxy-2-oxoglutarate aldolase